jgi:hypothetical protein
MLKSSRWLTEIFMLCMLVHEVPLTTAAGRCFEAVVRPTGLGADL